MCEEIGDVRSGGTLSSVWRFQHHQISIKEEKMQENSRYDKSSQILLKI